MDFLFFYLKVLPVILLFMTVLWMVSIVLKNVSIVDIFWGIGFIVAAIFYFFMTEGSHPRKWIVLILVFTWGTRLSTYIAWRNRGKGEDYRYRAFRKKYGEDRYWWISFFQVFLLQGLLMWLISAPLLGAMDTTKKGNLGILDVAGILLWVIGFLFEAGGDLQLARFKANPVNYGKVLDRGFWKYTRHPNYFGDTAIWWSFALFSLASGRILPCLGSLLMTYLIIRVSGVALLEKNLEGKKEGYAQYVRRTSAFIPWFPRKRE
jgi:steroid 5-alpha reductase family enzyme